MSQITIFYWVILFQSWIKRQRRERSICFKIGDVMNDSSEMSELPDKQIEVQNRITELNELKEQAVQANYVLSYLRPWLSEHYYVYCLVFCTVKLLNSGCNVCLLPLTLPDLSLLLPQCCLMGGGGGSVDPLLTYEPFALTTSNLVEHYV